MGERNSGTITGNGDGYEADAAWSVEQGIQERAGQKSREKNSRDEGGWFYL